MERKLRKGWLSVLLAIGVLSGLTAQKVITDHPDAKDHPVIDLSELDPIGAVLTRAGAHWRRDKINERYPRNDAMISGNDINGEWNARMSPLFQVMRKDLGVYTWADAYNACKAYSGEGGSGKQWRLPTQRELIMIFLLHPELRNKGGITAFGADFYMSCTELTGTSEWNVDFSKFTVSGPFKNNPKRFRCVRDL